MAPNDEFIREVDDEYRRDRVAQIWKRYNGVIIGVLVLLVAAGRGLALLGALAGNPGQAAAARYRGGAAPRPRARRARRRRPRFEALAKEATAATRCSPASASPPNSARTAPRSGATAYDALAERHRRCRRCGRTSRGCAPHGCASTRAEPLRSRPALERLAVPTEPMAPLRPRASGPVGPEERRYGFRRQTGSTRSPPTAKRPRP